MNAKRTIKKILALGAGVTMVGATVMGAMAYDLATYPAPFITNGVFSGKVVIGANAQAADTIGAVAIGTGLQAEAVSKQPIAIPGVTGQVSLSGDTFRIASGGDKLELRRAVGDVVDTVTGTDLQGLKSGHLSTSSGDTDYNQYIRLKDGTNLQAMGVNYITNDDQVMADYLVVDVSKPFMEWEIQFPSGFESGTYTNDGASQAFPTGTELRDLEDQTLNIMGQDYTVVQAHLTGVAGTPGIHMLLMGGSAPLTLKEGETQTITLAGVDHEVSLIFVSNPSGTGAVQAKFMVDNQQTRALIAGDTQTLAGGLQIGVRDILVNNQGGVASFFLGAHKIVIDAPTLTGTDFDGTIKIDQESASDGQVQAQGQFTDSSSSTFRLNDLKYELTMEATSSSTAYVPSGHGIRELMFRPAELISDAFDIKYEGLETVTTKPFTILSQGSDRYRLTFTNVQGQTYNFPYISNSDGVWRFGDQNYAFVFTEGATGNEYNIGRNDYFVVSNGGVDADKSVSNVLRYQSYDKSSSTLAFNDLATGTQNQVVLTTTETNASIAWPATGNLYVGGHTYTVNADNINSVNLSGATPVLAIDLDGQGFSAHRVNLTLWGGVTIDLASSLYDGAAGTAATVANDGFGKNITASSAVSNATVNMSMSVLSKNFANQGTGLGESLSWQVYQVGTAANSPQVGLSMSKAGYSGPHADANSQLYDEFVLDQKDPSSSSDHKVGMTDWGIAIDNYKPSDTTTPGSLTLQIPQSEEFAQVFMTMGSTTAAAGSGATADQVNPIAVGYAVLDKDAPALGSDNMIVVGGPCVNTVAAALMGNPADCTTGFTAGTALIQSYEQTGKVAILVAGYEAQDTLGASYALANHKDYPLLKGAGVEVVVPSLNAITVQAVTAPAPVAPTNTTQ